MHNSRRLAFAALAALLAACSQNKPTTAVAGGGACDAPDQVVATYSGKKVTMKEVDTAAGAELRKLEKQKFDLRQNALRSLLMKELVKEAAAKAGKTEEQWVAENIDSKVPQPTETELQTVYAKAQGQLPPGTSFDQVKPQILQFLTGQKRQEAMEGAFDELLKGAGGEVLLQEARVQVEAKGPSRGPADAKVTIVEFSDFQCPFCSRAEESVEQVMTAYAGKVRIFYRHFPLSFHPFAQKAAEAAACADEQGKFWDYHHTLFKNQQKLAVPDLKEHAATLGLDAAKFAECLDSGKMKATVDADQAEGTKAGVNGTPAFFINGVFLNGAQPFEAFDKVIKAELAKAK